MITKRLKLVSCLWERSRTARVQLPGAGRHGGSAAACCRHISLRIRPCRLRRWETSLRDARRGCRPGAAWWPRGACSDEPCCPRFSARALDWEWANYPCAFPSTVTWCDSNSCQERVGTLLHEGCKGCVDFKARGGGKDVEFLPENTVGRHVMEPGVVDEQSSVRRDCHDVDVSILPSNVVVGVALPRPQRVRGVVVDPADRQHQATVRAPQTPPAPPTQLPCLIAPLKDRPRQAEHRILLSQQLELLVPPQVPAV